MHDFTISNDKSVVYCSNLKSCRNTKSMIYRFNPKLFCRVRVTFSSNMENTCYFVYTQIFYGKGIVLHVHKSSQRTTSTTDRCCIRLLIVHKNTLLLLFIVGRFFFCNQCFNQLKIVFFLTKTGLTYYVIPHT